MAGLGLRGYRKKVEAEAVPVAPGAVVAAVTQIMALVGARQVLLLLLILERAVAVLQQETPLGAVVAVVVVALVILAAVTHFLVRAAAVLVDISTVAVVAH